MAAKDDFDVVVVNAQLELACSELVSLLVASTPDAEPTEPSG
jgi:guanylate kinase